MEKTYKMPQKNYKKITNTKHLRQILSLTINQLLNDEIASQTANSVASLANTMLKVLRATDLEDRITKLEQNLNGEVPDSKTTVTSDIQGMIKNIKTKGENLRERP